MEELIAEFMMPRVLRARFFHVPWASLSPTSSVVSGWIVLAPPFLRSRCALTIVTSIKNKSSRTSLLHTDPIYQFNAD